MPRSSNLRAFVVIGLLATAALLVGCGDKLSGTYEGEGGLLDKIEFTSGDKVEITALGQTQEGTYVVEDNKVKITIDGKTNVLTIRDDGCLEGGAMVGVFCKDGKKETAAKASGKAGKADDVVGNTYVATSPDGEIGLEFKSGGKVHMTMTGEEPMDATYTTNGDVITISSDQGSPMTLKHDGNALVANEGTMSIRFEKK